MAERAARVAARRSKPTRVVAARVSVWLRLGELWRARELFVFLVRKEIKVKYKNSVLGFLWSMLNPALTLAVFYVLFTYFLPNGIPNFVIYMFSAMLVWNLFQTGVLSGHQLGRVQRRHREEGGLPPRDPGPGVGGLGLHVLLVPVHRHARLHDRLLAPPRLERTSGSLIPALAAIVRLRRGPGRLPVGRERLPARHPAPGRGAPGGLVLGHPRRLRLLGPGARRRSQAHHLRASPAPISSGSTSPTRSTPVVMTFQRVFYNVVHPRSTRITQPSRDAPYGTPIQRRHGPLPDPLVRGVGPRPSSACRSLLFLGALVVFGHLEGNFAEEL